MQFCGVLSLTKYSNTCTLKYRDHVEIQRLKILFKTGWKLTVLEFGKSENKEASWCEKYWRFLVIARLLNKIKCITNSISIISYDHFWPPAGILLVFFLSFLCPHMLNVWNVIVLAKSGLSNRMHWPCFSLFKGCGCLPPSFIVILWCS